MKRYAVVSCHVERPLDDECWSRFSALQAKAPAGTTGVVNDAMALYFEDAAVAQAFVARFCCGYRIEPIAGALAIRDDAVKTRRVAAVHKAP